MPRAWRILPALPVTGNGKLDRAALPAPDLVTTAPTGRPRAVGGEPEAGHRSDIERRVRELWADEFGIDADGIAADASFFDLGGHSITAMRLVNQVREEFGTEYPMLSFYQEPTLRAMTTQLAAAAGETTPSGSASAPPEADDGHGTVERRAPATVQQARFATVHADHLLPQVFNVALRITLTGDLDVAALRTALTRLVERHEGLRTRLVRSGDGWEQQVLRPGQVELPVEDLTARSAGERQSALERASAEAAETPIDPADGKPMALRLLRTEDSRWVLLLVLHHSACDGWSVSLLLKELAALYGSAVTGEPHTLPPVQCQPVAYARWQREQDDETADERKMGFWLRELDGVPFTVDLPLDRPRPDERERTGRRRDVHRAGRGAGRRGATGERARYDALRGHGGGPGPDARAASPGRTTSCSTSPTPTASAARSSPCWPARSPASRCRCGTAPPVPSPR